MNPPIYTMPYSSDGVPIGWGVSQLPLAPFAVRRNALLLSELSPEIDIDKINPLNISTYLNSNSP